MNERQSLIPRELREIDFHGDTLVIALVDNGAYVALRPIAHFLDLDWSAQYRRVLRDEVLSQHIFTVLMIGADGRQREMLCLQLEYLPGCLFGITPSKIKPGLAPKLTRYREECLRALWRTFRIDVRVSLPALDAQERAVA